MLQYIEVCGYCCLVGLGGLDIPKRKKKGTTIDRLILKSNKYNVANVHCLAECEIGKAGVAQDASAKKKRIEVFPKLFTLAHDFCLMKYHFTSHHMLCKNRMLLGNSIDLNIKILN